MLNIFANHAHLFQSRVRAEGSLDSLLRMMDECEINETVAFAPFTKHFDKGTDNINQNQWLARKIKNRNRIWGFGTIDFDKDNLKEQVLEILELGLRGIKLHPAFQKFKIDCGKAFEVYSAAQQYGLSISFHTGVHQHRISDYNMLLFDEVAYHFKDLKFSMEHIGGYSFFNEGVAVMTNNRKNIYAGLTSVYDKDKNKFWYLGPEKTKDLLWLTGPAHSIFGLDFPYNNAEDIKHAIDVIRLLDIPDCEKQMILGENLRTFIGIN